MRVLSIESCLPRLSRGARVIDAMPSKKDVAGPGPQIPVNDVYAWDMSVRTSARQRSQVVDHSAKVPRLNLFIPWRPFR